MNTCVKLLSIGSALIITAIGGDKIIAVKAFDYIDFTFSSKDAGITTSIVNLVILFGFILCLLGIFCIVKQHKINSNKKIIVLEQRGLRDTSGIPLDRAIPNIYSGRRDLIVNDIRERIKDGFVTDPDEALKKVKTIPHILREHQNGLNRSEVLLAYGGLMPIPFTFLTGMYFDDEGSVLVLDWDRDAEKWSLLDRKDDKQNFKVAGLEIPKGSTEIILTVSVSYQVDLAAVQKTLPGLHVVQLSLINFNVNSHWSKEKQKRLKKQFREVISQLTDKNVKKIHLFISAQNSVVFNFGRSYDKRNYPLLNVYQYERSSTPPHPWAVSMPTHGIAEASIFRP